MWYNKIRGALEEMGFTEDPYDKVQISVCIYVDILLITSESNRPIDELENYMRVKFGKITVKDETVIDYVGMTFDFHTDGQVKFIMNQCGVDETAAIRASSALFQTRETKMAREHEIKWFQSNVANKLYLAKRVRPECLTVISSMASKVT